MTIIILQKEINGTVIPYGPQKQQKRVEEKTRQLSQVAQQRHRRPTWRAISTSVRKCHRRR
jgi:hypothetical protein